MKKLSKQYIENGGGVQIIPPAISDAHYERIFKIGAEQTESFDWKPYRPKFENQFNTYDCTNFSRTNAAEYMAKKAGVKDGESELNFSDLHLAVLSGTTKNGNNLNAPSEAFRTLGIVLQEHCQYDQDMLLNPIGTWAKRQQKVNAIPKDARRYKGGNHSWVSPIKAILKDALESSPLQIAVGIDHRWNEGGIIPRCVNPTAYHAIVLEKIFFDGRYRIFDSGTQEEKILASDYIIEQAKSFRDLPNNWKEVQKKTMFQLIKKKGKPEVCFVAFGKNYLIDDMDKVQKGQESGFFAPEIIEQDNMDINGEWRDFYWQHL
jgi:hypothetical protein